MQFHYLSMEADESVPKASKLLRAGFMCMRATLLVTNVRASICDFCRKSLHACTRMCVVLFVHAYGERSGVGGGVQSSLLCVSPQLFVSVLRITTLKSPLINLLLLLFIVSACNCAEIAK